MNYYHIIDHEGFGTIHRVLHPLCMSFGNHKMYTPDVLKDTKNAQKEMEKDPQAFVIIHSTGKMDTEIIRKFRSGFTKRPKGIFMHTSYRYQCLKEREGDMGLLAEMHKKDQTAVFVPSVEVSRQCSPLGIDAIPIQLGIPSIEGEARYSEYHPALAGYYDRIITTCSSSKPIYQYVKGLDLFADVVSRQKQAANVLIAGIDSYRSGEIPAGRFEEDDFLNILYHSKMYVQFSRYETYNLTAVQAKRFRIPVLLLEAEGNRSCMGAAVFHSIREVELAMQQVMDGMYDRNRIVNSYEDSCRRETIQAFADSLDRAAEWWMRRLEE